MIGNKINNENGFTLIELLVVIIIIAILSAIAIPLYLSQRQKAWDTNVESDLHNAAVAQVTYYQEASSYTTQVSDLLDVGYEQSSNINLSIVSASNESYCIEAYHDKNPARIWHVESGLGNPNPTVGSCT